MKYLKTYESKKFESIIDKIKDLPIIEDLRKCKKLYTKWVYNEDFDDMDEVEGRMLMFHTMDENNDKGSREFKEYKHKKRKKSTDTPMVLHKYVGELLQKNIGWNPREDALFVHNDQLQSGEDEYVYTNVGVKYIVLPIGEYKLVYSDIVNDLWTILYENFSIFNLSDYLEFWDDFPRLIDGEVEEQKNGVNDDWRDKQILEIYDFLDQYATSMKSNLCEWLGSDSEAMIKANSYYLIHPHYEQELIKYIWG